MHLLMKQSGCTLYCEAWLHQYAGSAEADVDTSEAGSPQSYAQTRDKIETFRWFYFRTHKLDLHKSNPRIACPNKTFDFGLGVQPWCDVRVCVCRTHVGKQWVAPPLVFPSAELCQIAVVSLTPLAHVVYMHLSPLNMSRQSMNPRRPWTSRLRRLAASA